MASKPDTEKDAAQGKKGSVAGSALVVLKFVLAFCLLPLVVGSAWALQAGLKEFNPSLQQAAVMGALAYVFMKFFVYDLDVVYKFGQGIVGACFQFLKPVMNFAPYVIPVYTLLAIIVYVVLNAAGSLGNMERFLMAVIAFTFTMHIVLTAQDLYAKDTTLGKPEYFFSMGLVFIVDMFLMALLMSLAAKGFSFVEFFQDVATVSGKIYMAVFRQLFVR